jgi:transcription termination factor NusB
LLQLTNNLGSTHWFADLTTEGIEPNPGPCGWGKLEKQLEKELGKKDFEEFRPKLAVLREAAVAYLLKKRGNKPSPFYGEDLLEYFDDEKPEFTKEKTADVIKKIIQDASGTFITLTEQAVIRFATFVELQSKFVL